VINKWDINPEASEKIERFCAGQKIPVIGKIPFDRAVMESVIAGRPVTEYTNGTLKTEMIRIWEAVKA